MTTPGENVNVSPPTTIKRSGKPRIGFHVSIAGDLVAAVGRAVERNCTAMQIFCGNPRGWTLQPRSGEEIERFRAERASARLRPVVVHACYLINPCAPDRSIYRRSLKRLTCELELTRTLSADLYVIHPGSSKGRNMAWAVRRAARCIGTALADSGFDTPLLLEGTAGSYGPGGQWQATADLADAIHEYAPSANIGVTVDTAHAWAAGCDFHKAAEVGRLLSEIDTACGPEALQLVHLNDSKESCGSGLDRHEHLCEGEIGIEGLANLLADRRISGLPLIMETPWVDLKTDARNMERALELLARPEARNP